MFCQNVRYLGLLRNPSSTCSQFSRSTGWSNPPFQFFGSILKLRHESDCVTFSGNIKVGKCNHKQIIDTQVITKIITWTVLTFLTWDCYIVGELIIRSSCPLRTHLDSTVLYVLYDLVEKLMMRISFLHLVAAPC